MCVEVTAPQVSTKDTVPWWHRLHRWTRWQREADMASAFKGLTGTQLVQARHCVRCGFAQVRPIKVPL